MLKPFQIVVLFVFAALAVTGILFFATYKGWGGTTVQIGKVTIWGSFPKELMDPVISNLQKSQQGYDKVTYVEKDPATFSQEYVEAIAEARGPDLILLPHDSILERQATLTVIPYSSFPERTFKDTYAEAGELYLTPSGVMGIPFSLDPLVLYWNRTLLAAKGIAKPPRYWDDVFTYAPKLTEKDQQLNIRKSAVALGEFSNILNAKDILSALLLQSGTSITARDDKGRVVSTLGDKGSSATVPAQDVVRFFTEFSNPTKSEYSWNRALPEAKQTFAAGDLAFYFGYASEAQSIRASNPNLNFDIAAFPQTRGAEAPSTYARITGFAIPKSSTNVQGAYQTALSLTTADSLTFLSKTTGLPPIRRDLLAADTTDPYLSLFNQVALVSHAWLDPSPRESATIFRNMTEAVTSGRLTISEAVSEGDRQLQNLLR